MSKIWDLVQFNGENELLEIRLETLKDVVDVFVIGSCEYSHSGIRKGLAQIPHELCLKFGYKIFYYEIPYISNPDPWYNEQYGRQYLLDKIYDKIDRNDILLVCDLDEIPNPEILRKESENLIRPVTFCGQYFLFCLDLWARTSIDGFLVSPKMTNYRIDLNYCRSHRTNFQQKDLFKHVPDSSWHFSSVGSPEWIAKKMSYFGHCNEFTGDVRNPEYIRKLIQGKCGNFKLDQPNVLQEWDISKLPPYIQQNKEKFKHLFYGNYALC